MLEEKHNEQMDAYGNLELSVVANSVLRRNFVMLSWMAENLTSSVKMPFLRLQKNYGKTSSILLLYTSQVKLLFLLLRNTTQNTSVTVKFVLK